MPERDRPNILVILCDQMKATASHLWGNTFCRTPHMARLADEGVLFSRAYTPHPLCVPARVSLWTGQYAHSHGARRNETLMPGGAVHAFRLWKEMGYTTGLIGKNHCYASPEDLALFDVWCEIGHTGLPEGSRTWGMDWFRPIAAIEAAHAVRRHMPQVSPRFSYAVSDYPLEDYSTGLIAGQTVRFLERHRAGPFALWVSFPDPHMPYEAPARYASLFPPEKIALPPWPGDELAAAPERVRVLHHMLGMDDDAREHVLGALGAYYGLVRFLDDGLGRILDALSALGLRENTIVVFCSDHGDFAGELGMMGKGGVFYDCLTRVPLIVSWPGQVPAGRAEHSMVNLVDVAPTLLRLQNLDAPRTMHGQALPTVTDAPAREAAFSEYGASGPPFTLADLRKLPQPYGRRAAARSLQWREAEGRRKMVCTRAWKYVHDPLGDADELYHLSDDPWELHNLAGDRAYRDVLMDLRLKLADWSMATEDARPVPLPAADKYALGI